MEMQMEYYKELEKERIAEQEKKTKKQDESPSKVGIDPDVGKYEIDLD